MFKNLFMKKVSTAALVVVFALCFVVPVFAVTSSSSGTKVFSQQVTLLSSTATGTTSAYNTGLNFTFDAVMDHLSCDFITVASGTTGNTTYVIDANQGSSTTLFDSTTYGILSFTQAGSASASVISSKTMTVDYPFRTIRATVTAPTITATYTINCSGSQ